MALRKCRECGGQVSTWARRCPHCGVRHPGRGIVGTIFSALLVTIIVLSLFVWFGSCALLLI